MQPYGPESFRLLCPWDSPGEDTRMGYHVWKMECGGQDWGAHRGACSYFLRWLYGPYPVPTLQVTREAKGRSEWTGRSWVMRFSPERVWVQWALAVSPSWSTGWSLNFQRKGLLQVDWCTCCSWLNSQNPGLSFSTSPAPTSYVQKNAPFMYFFLLNLEEGMATPSSILACRIPMDRGAWWAIQSMGLQKVRHD